MPRLELVMCHGIVIAKGLSTVLYYLTSIAIGWVYVFALKLG